ncbi:MAG: DUF805 domain-containing protein, partial [Gammaproteobacteria bacterium]|nr:DUF805 domain-containing protein [Gammaproteobacteria bacterium]
MENYINALRKYAEFNGRTTRAEYWTFYLVNLVIALILIAVTRIGNSGSLAVGVIFIMFLLVIATLVPTLSITTRRLHDTGRSGWWQLMFLVPYIGQIVLA